MRVLPESAVRYLPLDDSAHTRQPGLWLRRRARRLARFYGIDRREALRAAPRRLPRFAAKPPMPCPVPACGA